MKKRIRFVQRQLNLMGLNAGPVDGFDGPTTISALDQVDNIPLNWAKRRKITWFIQNLCEANDIECGPVDGYWGHLSEQAFEILEDRLENDREAPIWRPEDLPDVNPNEWPTQNDIDELTAYYGEPGTNQDYAQLPYQHRLSWKLESSIDRFKCHQLVKPSIERVLQRVLDHYGKDAIQELRLDIWGGCSVVRKMRGGSKPSMHSWGIAIDYDPTRNKLKWGRDRAVFARSEYDAWWSLWEAEGWVSLGRNRNFDWMHVQAAKL